MNIILWIVLITFVAGVCGTGLGGVISALIRRNSKNVVSFFLSFAAGVMLSVVCFSLIEDALFPKTGELANALPLTIVGVLAGYAIVTLLNYWIDRSTNHEVKHIDKNHPKTADDLDELIHYDHFLKHKQTDDQLFLAGIVMACAIALHNIPEGIVIGAAYASNGVTLGGSGLIMAAVIGLHNIPEGMAVAVPLISGGMPKSRAILMTALSGAPTILGAIFGYCVGSISPVSLALSLSFASGAMLCVVFGELLPEAYLMQKSKLPAFAVIVGMLVGIVIIFV